MILCLLPIYEDPQACWYLSGVLAVYLAGSWSLLARFCCGDGWVLANALAGDLRFRLSLKE